MDSGKPEVYRATDPLDGWCVGCEQCDVTERYYWTWAKAFAVAQYHADRTQVHWRPASWTYYDTLLTLDSILEEWISDLKTIPVFTSPS